MRKLLTILPAAGLILGVSACREEPNSGVEPTPGIGAKTSVTFTVGNSQAITKGGAGTFKSQRLGEIQVTDGENGFMLTEDVISLDAGFASSEAETKGTPVYTENFGELFTNITGLPYDTDKGTVTTATTITPATGISFTKSSDSPLRYKADIASWPKENKLFYFSVPNGGGDGVSNLKYKYANYPSDKIVDNSYTNVFNGIIDFDYTSPKAATSQEDILFTSKSLSEEMTTSDAGLLFYHALAGVKFKSGNATADGITKVTKIELKGVKNSGHCTVTPTYDAQGYAWRNTSNGDDDVQVDKSATVSQWTGVKLTSEADGTFSLANEQGIGITSDCAYDYPDSFFSDGETSLSEDNFNSADYASTFYFIPQTTENVTLTITFVVEKNGAVISGPHTKEVDFSGRTWKAGYLYTYSLTGRVVDVDVNDVLTGQNLTTKEQLTITNTGNMNAYIRAAVIANWYDKHYRNQIVDSWLFDPASNLFVDLQVSDDWVYSTDDGFFYYKYIVKPGEATNSPIFTSYTSPLPPDAHPTAHLEMTIAAQAIRYDAFEAVGTEATEDELHWKTSLLTTTVEE